LRDFFYAIELNFNRIISWGRKIVNPGEVFFALFPQKEDKKAGAAAETPAFRGF
jgi:hypothetical protein